jgi:hypothetical protein
MGLRCSGEGRARTLWLRNGGGRISDILEGVQRFPICKKAGPFGTVYQDTNGFMKASHNTLIIFNIKF